MPPIDKAILEGVKQTKKEAHAELSHRRQLRRSSARKRNQIAVGAARATEQRSLLDARAAGQRSVIEAREGALTSRRSAQRSEARQQRVIGAGVSGAKTAVGATDLTNSNTNIFLTTIMMIVMLAVFYQVVTKAEAFGGFLEGLGDLLHKVSSTTPLFKSVSK